jgi:hypothetical protein
MCYQFVDFNKLILDRYSCIFARFFCLVNDLCEVAPLVVAQQHLQVAREPKLYAVLFVRHILEGGVELLDNFFFHGLGFCLLWASGFSEFCFF